MRENFIFWMSCWCALALLFLPFPFVFLPNIGTELSTFMYPLNAMICSWFDTDIQHSYLVSDSMAFYATGLILIITAGLLTLLIRWKKQDLQPTVQKILFYILILLLAYFLIHYGLDKLFHRQFYIPTGNTLHTSVGHLGKDILFWTSMGTSSFYNTFMAITEISAGVLLLFNQTRFFGLVVGFGILLNIFAINIGFDITVKYLSGLLLITCSVCLSFFTSNLWILIGRKSPNQFVPVINQKWMFIFFIPLAFDLCATYWNITPKDSSKSYAVLSTTGTSQHIDTKNIVRIHFHPDGYLITEDKQQIFKSYPISKDGHSVKINQQLIGLVFQKNTLIWIENNLRIFWEMKEIDLEKMVLMQDETNWYFESIVSKL